MREKIDIDERTAQLIFDAIAWSNRDWCESLNWSDVEFDLVASSRSDFVRFCEERGIESVKVVREV